MEKIYSPEEFSSISAFAKVDDLSALGFSYVLKDICGGRRKGIIDLKSLASSLNISMMRCYNFIGILEDAFIIRTIAVPEGRQIEFLDVPEAEQTVTASQECLDYITGYLKAHGIEPVKAKDCSKISSSTILTAKYLGDNFNRLKTFYSALKATLNDCREFSFTMPGTDDIRTFNAVMVLARNLYSLGLLSVYEYVRKPQKILRLQAANTPEAHSFISGGWLEHYIYSKALSILTADYACIRNLQAVLPDGEQCELDLLICSDKNVFWIECKTGKYSLYLQKYSRIAKTLELAPHKVILVTAEAPVSGTVSEYGITCCSLDNFSETFSRACT